MDKETFDRIVLLRDKREYNEEFLNRFINNEGNTGVVFYSDVFKEMVYTTFHEFEDLQNELNDYIKTWAKEKIEEIDNEIKEL